jgi:ABC-2 type transport system ATP-binding protein
MRRTDMSEILRIENLNKDFKDFSLRNINLSLERGYIMGFIGPNGAGKSTTIKLVMNLMRRQSGTIEVFGLDNIEHEREAKERIGFVYDENVYYEELTVMQMKRVVAPFYTHWDDGKFTKLIKEFDLPPAKKIKELSKGMKMKFALAVALSHGAELLIMDEPTSGLDPLVRSELLEILTREMQDGDKAVFFSTHITSDLDKVADYIALIDQGEIKFSSTKDELVERCGLVKGANGLLDGDTRKAFVGVKENKFGFEGLARDRKEARMLFGDKVVIERPTLEEIMLYFTRRNQDA